MKGKTVLILGSGQIGEACAIRFLSLHPKTVIVHCLTKEEAEISGRNIRKHIDSTSTTKVLLSWGNALVPTKLMFIDREHLHNDPKNRRILMNYYYGYLNDNLIKHSSLYHLIKKWKPDYIFDGINTATVVGYQDDPYSLPRSILDQKHENNDENLEHLLVSNIVPSLIRFSQALKLSLLDFKVNCYVKISTTGLGGMGNNLMYTHGDVNEPGMSSGILGKVAAAGVIHQLLWSLSHTPGINVKVVVPAALVGWQGVYNGKFRSHGKNLPLVDSRKRFKLVDGEIFSPMPCEKMHSLMEMPYVDSGENCAYSLGEMTAITALGQMECVTREEVAEAAVETALGSTRHDILTAMDMVSLGPSHIAAVQRSFILSNLQDLEKKSGTKSIATNNLGPTVSKHLFEIFLLMETSGYSLKQCLVMNPLELSKKMENYLITHQSIRSQIVSLGLPIIYNNGEVTVGEYYYVPNSKIESVVSKPDIDIWAKSGWVDIRENQVKFWQSLFQNIIEDSARCNCTNKVVLDRNWQHIDEGNIGELLGYVYSLSGGERRTIWV